MFNNTDKQLLSRILNNRYHVLQSYFPGLPCSKYNLRTITHNSELITKMYKLNKRDFIMRMLYNNYY